MHSSPIKEQMWWCICIPNDCSHRIYGPFETEERARKEANCACDYAHVVSHKNPPVEAHIEGVCKPSQFLSDNEMNAHYDHMEAHEKLVNCCSVCFHINRTSISHRTDWYEEEVEQFEEVLKEF